jgi:hypothetical protein
MANARDTVSNTGLVRCLASHVSHDCVHMIILERKRKQATSAALFGET